MNKVLILRGLPASGKTTHAMELVKRGYKRVNKDDLRAMIDGGRYSGKNEKLILEMRDMIIDLALIHGYDVVVDDTNFAQKHFDQIASIAEINGAELEVKVFDTPLKDCIRRDARRKNKVGERVIREMHDRYIADYEEQF